MAFDVSALRDGFRLARWRIDPLRGQIRSPRGARRHVSPKAMNVLVCLASKPGEVVSRQALLDEVWGAQSTSGEALTHSVGELRRALGDHADSPEFLRTIPRQGYQLIAEVRSDLEEGPSRQGSAVASQLNDLRKRKVFQALLGYPVLAWLLVQVIDVLWEYLLEPLGAPAWLVPTIVVLLAVGYPVAVFFAWAVELTPDGVKITESGEGSRPVIGLIGTGTVTVAVAAVALFLFFNANDQSLVNPRISLPATPPPVRFDRSIAVLRFTNMSEDTSADYIGDGLTEELIHEMANLKTIKVAARTSVWPLSDSSLGFDEIASRLKVEKILEGSVRIDGDQLRVTAQLIDEDGFHLWSQTYDRTLEDVLDIQKDIAVQVVDELDVLLEGNAKIRLNDPATKIGAAYDKYLQGQHYLRMPSTHEFLDFAQSFFDAAITLDNRFPLGYAGLCEVHLARYRLTRDTDDFSLAEKACHRALTLDGGLAEVYTVLGNLYRHSGQFVDAEQEYLAALDINPTLEEANFGLGRAYQAQGRLVDAEQTLLRSIELEPAYWGGYMGVGNFYYRQGRYAEAVPQYEAVTELAPDYAGGFINLGSSQHWLGDWNAAETAWKRALELSEDAMTYQNLGTLNFYQDKFVEAAEYYERAIALAPKDHRNWGKLAAAQRFAPDLEAVAPVSYRKAIQLVEAQLAVNPNDQENLYFLSVYLLRTGDIDGAEEAIELSIKLGPESPSPHYFSALIELQAGNPEKAMNQLEKAAELGYSLRLIKADPDLRSLRNEERFRALTGQ